MDIDVSEIGPLSGRELRHERKQKRRQPFCACSPLILYRHTSASHWWLVPLYFPFLNCGKNRPFNCNDSFIHPLAHLVHSGLPAAYPYHFSHAWLSPCRWRWTPYVHIQLDSLTAVWNLIKFWFEVAVKVVGCRIYL